AWSRMPDCPVRCCRCHGLRRYTCHATVGLARRHRACAGAAERGRACRVIIEPGGCEWPCGCADQRSRLGCRDVSFGPTVVRPERHGPATLVERAVAACGCRLGGG